MIVILTLTGCSTSANEESAVLYDNAEVSLTIYQTSSDWEFVEDSNDIGFSATFINDNIRANITIVDGNRWIEEIKEKVFLEELMTMVEESSNYLSFLTNKENIRTDIYTELLKNETLIITFVALEEDLINNEDDLLDFKNNIEITK